MRKKIFIIEDDANIASAMQAKFSIEGFEVDVNHGNVGGKELMNDIIRFAPNYIILDIMLPKVDGFELAKDIKEAEELKDVTVFVFTNLGDNDSRAKGEVLGINYYFIKSDLNIDGFVLKIKKIISNKEKVG